ncbi:MAG: L-seryl-tRNA(Sec) selenium transferase, partial [Thermodesulfovibrionales bacterium]
MVEKDMEEKQKILSSLPSVDEILRSEQGKMWLNIYPRRYLIQAIREVLDSRRKEILKGQISEISEESMMAEIENTVERLSSYSLKPLINATGVVIHTNLGRSLLSDKTLENIKKVSGNYSNLEYDLRAGKRGKRYVHVVRILREVTGA